MRLRAAGLLAALAGGAVLFLADPASSQANAEDRGSDNIEVLAHLPLGERVSDIEIEQDLARPYVYVARENRGLDVIDVADPYDAKVILRWSFEDMDLHVGSAGKDIKIFEHGGRNYVVHSVQFRQGGPDADLGAVIFDATDLPDVSTFREVARIQGPVEIGGFPQHLRVPAQQRTPTAILDGGRAVRQRLRPRLRGRRTGR